MIYFLLIGVVFFVIVVAISVYCRFVYSAMLDDINVKGHHSLEKDKEKISV